LLAHLFLLHEVLDVGALSAGVWWMALDFQLDSLLALLLWLGQRGGQPSCAMALAPGTTGASLLWWNAQNKQDNWAWYFFDTQQLGALARWAQVAPPASASQAVSMGQAGCGGWPWCCWPDWRCGWTCGPAWRWRWRCCCCWSAQVGCRASPLRRPAGSPGSASGLERCFWCTFPCC
jgi:hypothetical protein